MLRLHDPKGFFNMFLSLSIAVILRVMTVLIVFIIRSGGYHNYDCSYCTRYGQEDVYYQDPCAVGLKMLRLE